MTEFSVRSSIMDLIKTKFLEFGIWNKLEAPIALKCSELTEPTTDKKSQKLVEELKGIKRFLLTYEGIHHVDVEFLDEEMDIYESTKQVSSFSDDENDVPKKIIDKYAGYRTTQEGIFAISQKYNFRQLEILTDGVYQRTGFIKFYISNEKRLYGKIIAEIDEYPQEIPIATLVQSKVADKDSGEKERMVSLFGRWNKNKYERARKDITEKFYLYRFITDKNVDMILLSQTKCEIGDYVVVGVTTFNEDYKLITDTAKIPTKLPLIFAQSVKNRIIKYKNHKEFFDRVKHLGITEEKNDFFNFPFSIRKKNKGYILLHPKWYKWFIWSWILHERKGTMNTYPLHILQVGPAGSGKSLLLNGLHAQSKESKDVFSGSSSTLKSLIPSFKYNPAKLGYLAESNRFSYCDEFLRCLVNTRTTKEGSEREESVALMNDLLEHQKREAGSGVSRVKINMTSRIFATTNPIKGIHNVQDLIKKLEQSFLCRWIIYYQTDDHVRMIRKSNDKDLKLYKFRISTDDWVSLIDYLHTFSADYNENIVAEIHDSVKSILSEDLKNHYDARHKHHISCIMDGIVKTRCMIEGDDSFKAKEVDYKILKKVWTSIIRSWLNPEHIKDIEKKDKIFYLPENCQFIYWKLYNKYKRMKVEDIQEMVKQDMNENEFAEAWTILKEMNLILEEDSIAKVWCFEEMKIGDQKRLSS